jgi:hypothetical protein
MKLTTTLHKIKAAHACADGYRTLAKHLGGCESYGMDTEINLLTVLESNGVQDMIWCFRCTVEDSKLTASQLAIEFAAECLPIFEQRYPNDFRPRGAIDAARGYMAGAVTFDELKKARFAAYTAAADAADDAADAATYTADTAADAATAAYAAYDDAADAAAAAYSTYAYANAADSRAKAKERQAEIIRIVLE